MDNRRGYNTESRSSFIIVETLGRNSKKVGASGKDVHDRARNLKLF